MQLVLCNFSRLASLKISNATILKNVAPDDKGVGIKFSGGNLKKYRKIALLSLFQGGGGGIAPVSLYLLYLYRV